MCEFESIKAYLPDSVKAIVEVIGLPATEKFVKAFGGASFLFTHSASYFDRLREVLGQENAVKLQRYMGVGEVYIPRCEVALKMLRNQRIYADFCHLTEVEKQSGRAAVAKLCILHQVSDRTVWAVVHTFQRTGGEIQHALF